MVVFSCNSCNETLKKNRVDKHLMNCNSSSLTCLDCNKDFSQKSYAAHVKCISEEEKYSGTGYVAKASANKGERKQNAWVEQVQAAISSVGNTEPQLSRLLGKISEMDNVPRKQAKFMNFLKNSFRGYPAELFEKAWTVIQANVPKVNSDSADSNKSSSAEKRKKDDEEGTEESPKKRKKKASDSDIEDVVEVGEKSKKKKKKKSVSEDAEVVPKKSKKAEDGEEFDGESKSSKKKTKKGKENSEETEDIVVIESPKKKKKKDKGMEDEIVEAINGSPKKKKNKDKENAKETEDVVVQESPKKKKKDEVVEDEAVDTIKGSSKKKKKSESSETLLESTNGNGDVTVEDGGKFDWCDEAANVLAARESQQMKMKRLQKLVVASYREQHPDASDKSVERGVKKFDKRLSNDPRFTVNEEVILLTSQVAS